MEFSNFARFRFDPKSLAGFFFSSSMVYDFMIVLLFIFFCIDYLGGDDVDGEKSICNKHVYKLDWQQ